MPSIRSRSTACSRIERATSIPPRGSRSRPARHTRRHWTSCRSRAATAPSCRSSSMRWAKRNKKQTDMKGFEAMRGNWILGFAVLALTGLLGGCGGSDTIKPAELVNFKPTARTQVVWRDSVGGSDVYIFTPAVYDGAVYAAGAGGTLGRFDANSGKSAWRVDTKQELSGGVGADDGLVVVATKKGVVLAYDVRGKPVWKSQVSSEVLMAPRIAEGVVVVR